MKMPGLTLNDSLGEEHDNRNFEIGPCRGSRERIGLRSCAIWCRIERQLYQQPTFFTSEVEKVGHETSSEVKKLSHEAGSEMSKAGHKVKSEAHSAKAAVKRHVNQ